MEGIRRIALPVVLLLFFHPLAGAQNPDCEQLVERGGRLLDSGGAVPFTGCCTSTYFEEDGRSIRSRAELCYREGLPHGAQRYFYADSSLMALLFYSEGAEDSTWTYYYPDGSVQDVSHYDMGTPVSTWYDYFPDGSLFRSEQYHDGRQVNWRKYANDRTLLASMDYLAGHGEYHLRFYDDGGLERAEWHADGRLDSLCFYYRPNGKLKAVMSYDAGYLQDTSWYYHRNGRLESAGVYSGGEKADEYIFYDRKGRISQRVFPLGEGEIRVETYRRGKLRKSEVTGL